MALLILVLSATVAVPVAEAGTRTGGRVRLAAGLVCLTGGGANVTFTVSNVGGDTVVLDGDFHLFLEKATTGGLTFAGAAFVFPAAGFDTIAPGGASTFQVPIGDAVEGEPGTDLSAHRLILEAEVFLEGRARPVVRRFTFPGCDL